MIEPTEQEVDHLANLIGDDTKARFLLENHGPQAMADRRAAEVLDEMAREFGNDPGRARLGLDWAGTRCLQRAAELRGEQS